MSTSTAPTPLLASSNMAVTYDYWKDLHNHTRRAVTVTFVSNKVGGVDVWVATVQRKSCRPREQPFRLLEHRTQIRNIPSYGSQWDRRKVMPGIERHSLHTGPCSRTDISSSSRMQTKGGFQRPQSPKQRPRRISKYGGYLKHFSLLAQV